MYSCSFRLYLNMSLRALRICYHHNPVLQRCLLLLGLHVVLSLLVSCIFGWEALKFLSTVEYVEWELHHQTRRAHNFEGLPE